MKKGGQYESASCDDGRPGVPLVGLARCDLRPGNLPGRGVVIAVLDRVDSERRLLAETTPATEHPDLKQIGNGAKSR